MFEFLLARSTQFADLNFVVIVTAFITIQGTVMQQVICDGRVRF